MKVRIKHFLLVFITVLPLILMGCKERNTSGKSDIKSIDNLTNTEMPIVKDPITFKIFSGQPPNSTSVNWNDILIWNEYKEMTNINVEWELTPTESLEEKRNLLLASDDLPDVFYATQLPIPDLYKYGKQGTFIELNDLIDKHAPHFKKLMEDDPSIRDAITFPDGSIYSLPYLASPDFVAFRTNPFLWVNKEWIEELEIDLPKTTDEFYQYLKAVKESDLKGNENQDVIPYGDDSIGRLITKLYGAFGLNNRGSHNSFVDMDPNENKLRFFPTSDQYKEMLEYVHKLYSEELIQQNIYSTDNSQYIANNENNLYGSTTYWPTPMLFGENESIALEPLEGPYGDKKADMTHPVLNIGSFAITRANENPEAAIRWVDYFYSNEGSKLFYMGIEGKTYEETADGKFEYLEEILTEATIGKSTLKYLAWAGTGAPSLLKQEYFSGSEASVESLEASKKSEPYVIDEVWPAFTYTEEENKELIPLEADIAKYVSEKQSEFITGRLPFSKWDDYVKTLNNIGLEDYMRIKTQAYERMVKN